MAAPKLNPFRYGKPVPPTHFVGRIKATRTIFSRIKNRESTSIVGDPHIGKSSLLCYIADERVRSEWLGADAWNYSFIEIDCHMLPTDYQPADFWSKALTEIQLAFPDDTILKQLEIVRGNNFGSIVLERLFKRLSREGRCVIMLIDEFDSLLHQLNFNRAEFFGALRSIATRTDGLALVTASRMSITEMNQRGEEIHPVGSPYFNFSFELRLPPLRVDQVDRLLDQALDGTEVTFSPEARDHIRSLTGRHPYLVQMAGAALFELLESGKDRKEINLEISRALQHEASDHFATLWRQLSTGARRALWILVSTALPLPNNITGDLDWLGQYDLELGRLAGGGLIERVEGEEITNRQVRGWQLSAMSFAHWLIHNRKWEDIEGRATGSQLDETERIERINSLREKLAAKQRRLQQRELQRSQLGLSADPSVVTEIEDLQRAIADDERELHRLGGQV